jgi:trans-aconitate 2-methyltransferase
VPREWDARTYDTLPLLHQQWGRGTLERLRLRGDEVVLDAGCGTGRDTALLLERLPSGRVVAVDASSRMLERLRERLAGRLDRVEVIQADLTEPLPAGLEVDAVFSVAAFHWITDHQTLFANLAKALRPGGQLVAECGGQGNVASVVLGSHLDRLPAAERDGFVRAVAERLPEPVVDYVRLTISARRG